MSETIEINDKGLKQLLKALKISRLPVARVGVLGNKNARSGEGSNATVGAVHEFGTSTHPRRSFLRVPLTEELNGFLEGSGAFTREALAKVIKLGSISPWMEKVGAVAVEVVLGAFESGGFGKWKPSVGKYKKVQQTLVETTQLMNSITYDVKS